MDFEGPLPWTIPVRHIFVGQTWSPFDAITSIPTASQQQMALCEGIVSQDPMSDEGKLALAKAMIEPIKISLEYQGIGQKLLMVDELPHSSMSLCDQDIPVISHGISRRRSRPLPKGRIRFVDVEEEM